LRAAMGSTVGWPFMGRSGFDVFGTASAAPEADSPSSFC
jgi:hypothetical protein